MAHRGTNERERVAVFREDFRAATVPSTYRWWRHIALVVSCCVAAIVLAVTQMDGWYARYLAVVPGTYVFANLAEYVLHRGCMHRVRWPLEFLYRRHSGTHHRFFTQEMMAVDSSQDLPAVLFPARVSLFFIGGVGAPVAAAVGWVTHPDVGWLFLAVAVAYYLSYELLHLGTHLPHTHWWGRAKIVCWIRTHHAAHHDPRRMRHIGFNITLPLWDRVFGTSVIDAPPARSAADSAGDEPHD